MRTPRRTRSRSLPLRWRPISFAKQLHPCLSSRPCGLVGVVVDSPRAFPLVTDQVRGSVDFLPINLDPVVALTAGPSILMLECGLIFSQQSGASWAESRETTDALLPLPHQRDSAPIFLPTFEALLYCPCGVADFPAIIEGFERLR